MGKIVALNCGVILGSLLKPNTTIFILGSLHHHYRHLVRGGPASFPLKRGWPHHVAQEDQSPAQGKNIMYASSNLGRGRQKKGEKGSTLGSIAHPRLNERVPKEREAPNPDDFSAIVWDGWECSATGPNSFRALVAPSPRICPCPGLLDQRYGRQRTSGREPDHDRH
jgi:hypothetical protein